MNGIRGNNITEKRLDESSIRKKKKMRIHLKLTANNKVVPFNCQPQLVGALHKWIGKNNTSHDKRSLYSLSWLKGGKVLKNGLDFKKGASMFISSPDINLIKTIIKGIQIDSSINYGLEVKELVIQETPTFSNRAYFYLENPIFIKYRKGNNTIHYTYREDASNEIMTNTLKNKLKQAGINDVDVAVRFDKEYGKAKVKKIDYRNIENKVSQCPIIIEGNEEAIAFAWNVGIGNSTGIGFGSLK